MKVYFGVDSGDVLIQPGQQVCVATSLTRHSRAVVLNSFCIAEERAKQFSLQCVTGDGKDISPTTLDLSKFIAPISDVEAALELDHKTVVQEAKERSEPYPPFKPQKKGVREVAFFVTNISSEPHRFNVTVEAEDGAKFGGTIKFYVPETGTFTKPD